MFYVFQSMGPTQQPKQFLSKLLHMTSLKGMLSFLKIPVVSMSTGQGESARVEKTLNQVTLLGRVGGDPQKRGTEEHPVVIFSIATHTNYKYESGEMVQKTDWHRVCVFKPSLRDTVYTFLKKGQRVYISGRLTYGEVKDESGNPRTTTAVVADDVIFFQT